ncbi:MAG: 3'-5' exonuclease [Chitinophagia bacterium]|nr:3'-5' exonuclease [Chitinophagia bacterium]NCA30490.1 3'-5' exonuclease [Chitinophagia bacterium]NDD16693.1 3'-5' exonuclease [Chitinophagia bacterium]
MEFAVVDIETTGSTPQSAGITEIAIVIHNGVEVTGKYVTLINPRHKIPPFIVNMTGISDEMVAAAPLFEEVAPQIYNLLNGRVFVAHNVSFDYSFVHYLLGRSGFQWSAPKLCTIKLSRRVFPGLEKYGLGSLTRDLGIRIEGRHRAWGDAAATAQVLTMAIEKEGMKPIHNLLAKKEPRKKIVPRTEMPNDRSDAED